MAIVEQERTERPEGWLIEEPPQHVVALESGNQVRLRRSAFRRRVKQVAGRRPGTAHPADCPAAKRLIAETVLESPWWLEKMRLIDVLRLIPRWAEPTVTTYLSRLQISETKTVGSLTERQRRIVAENLGDCGATFARRNW